jgi:hypothetical protein
MIAGNGRHVLMTLDPFGFSPETRAHARRARGRHSRRPIAAAIMAGALLLAASGVCRAAATGMLHLRCTNTASGASWPIAIDLDRGRVDSQAATITDKWISWRDPKQGFFDLDRATGRLQFRNASSTGGYFLYYSCRQE